MTLTGGRFLAPFLEHEANFTDSQIGTTLALQYLIMSVTSPFFGQIADRAEAKLPHYGRAFWLMGGILVGTICFSLHGAPDLLKILYFGESFPSYLQADQPSSSAFAFHLSVQCGYALCLSLEFPVLDGMALSYLQLVSENTNEYGLERVFGAISWGLTSLLLGFLLDASGLGWKVTYLLILISMCACIIAILYYARAQAKYAQELDDIKRSAPDTNYTVETPSPGTTETPEQVTEASPLVPSSRTSIDPDRPDHQERYTQFQLMGLVLGPVYGLAFCGTYFVLASGLSVVENMVFLFFEFLGGSNTICGITVLLTVLLELPMFQYAPNLLQKYGPGILLIAAGLSFIVRIVGYTLIPQGQLWMVLLLEPLHGVTYAGSQTAAVEFISEKMPPGMEASGQGIVNLVRGSGSVLGLYLAGHLESTVGPRSMYRGFAVVISLSIVSFIFIHKQQRSMYHDQR